MLTVDLDALAANYRYLRDRLDGCECGAVVKADGYGLGAGPVARTLAGEGCRRFFVADADEGLALRGVLDDIAPDASIHVFDGATPGTEDALMEANLIPVLGDPDQVARWAEHGRAPGGAREPRPAVIEIDTGMGRHGLDPAEFEALAASPDRLDGLRIDYVISHLACAEETDNPMNARQLSAFGALRARLPRAKASLANSSGIFLGAAFHFDLVRPGAALYGVWSIPNRPNPMTQVVSLKAKIIRVRDVDSDLTVGYGATRRVGRGRRIAIAAAGYADGYPRALSNRAYGYVGGARVPVVGRVSMDIATFDVTDAPSDAVRPGASIDLIGPHCTVDDVAAAAGTIGYEILTGFGRRLRRVYLGGTG